MPPAAREGVTRPCAPLHLIRELSPPLGREFTMLTRLSWRRHVAHVCDPNPYRGDLSSRSCLPAHCPATPRRISPAPLPTRKAIEQNPCQTRPRQATARSVRPLRRRSRPSATSALRSPPDSRCSPNIKNRLPASAELTLFGLHPVDVNRRAAGHPCRGEAGLLDRPHLPRGGDRRGVAAGVLHRAVACLCVLFPAGLVAGAARTPRCILFATAAASPASISSIVCSTGDLATFRAALSQLLLPGLTLCDLLACADRTHDTRLDACRARF